MAASESDSERDGVLSYSSEWHALALGFAAGYGAAARGRWRLLGGLLLAAVGFGPVDGKAQAEILREPWYFVGGTLFGIVPGAIAHLRGRQ